ncbi:(d)CMP kinase [Endozoicomonas sp. Mp262]|uniref:(d)CMP kinase n=1 Tax=Endozoicomonas sp. Mp262 TaxID=2919499 RepID=UPI0021DA3BF8
MSSEVVSAPIVTIDGPSGSGKGTIAALLAKTLGWQLLDSGALYRLTALSASNHGIDLDDESAVALVAAQLDVQFQPGSDSLVIILEGESVGVHLRTEEVGAMASKVAVMPKVRAALLQRQRDFATLPGLICDGRDMGTVVFPNASAKFFLTASAEERARRRMEQLQAKGIDGSFDRLLADIKARDERDTNRSVAPLKPADEAIVIDSSQIGIQEVFDRVMTELRQRGLV